MMSRVITLMFYQTALGSSPRVWGQVGQFTTQWYSERIIPTRVGTSGVLLPNILYRRDHPHACGDKSCQPKSSVILTRIIPTRVGTSFSVNFLMSSRQDHPHACGDKYRRSAAYIQLTGSSPRVWGQGRLAVLPFGIVGIIPTRMGTRAVCIKRLRGIGDHPHAYGDKSSLLSVSFSALGSSPRVWGQEDSDDIESLESRIIPTRMGTSRFPFCSNRTDQDHPHAYGDKRNLVASSSCVIGSSPRV